MGPSQGGRTHFREAQEADLARLHQLGHGVHGVLHGHLGILAVLVVEVDDLHNQPLQAGVAGAADMVGVAADASRRGVGRIADDAELGGDDHLVPHGRQGLAHQDFVDVGAVHIGGIEERDPAFHGVADGGRGFRVIAMAVEVRHAHAAETEGGYRKSLGSEGAGQHGDLLGGKGP